MVVAYFKCYLYGLFALFWVFPLSKVSAPRVFLYFHDFLVVFCLFLSAHLIFPALFMPYWYYFEVTAWWRCQQAVPQRSYQQAFQDVLHFWNHLWTLRKFNLTRDDTWNHLKPNTSNQCPSTSKIALCIARECLAGCFRTIPTRRDDHGQAHGHRFACWTFSFWNCRMRPEPMKEPATKNRRNGQCTPIYSWLSTTRGSPWHQSDPAGNSSRPLRWANVEQCSILFHRLFWLHASSQSADCCPPTLLPIREPFSVNFWGPCRRREDCLCIFLRTTRSFGKICTLEISSSTKDRLRHRWNSTTSMCLCDYSKLP